MGLRVRRGSARGARGELACPSQTIREVQPDVVVVELCQYRVSMLKMDERTLLREAKEISLEKLQQAVRQVRVPAPWTLWSGTLHPGPRDTEERQLRPQPQGRSWSGTLRAPECAGRSPGAGVGTQRAMWPRAATPLRLVQGLWTQDPSPLTLTGAPRGMWAEELGVWPGGVRGERGHPWGRGQAAGLRLQGLRWACSGKAV